MGCSLCSRGAEFWAGAQRQGLRGKVCFEAGCFIDSQWCVQEAVSLNRGVSIFKIIKASEEQTMIITKSK